MARINIEECWWKNQRRKKLIELFKGEECLITGIMVDIWMASQQAWGKEKGGFLIPGKEFISYFKGAAETLQVGLARLYKVKCLEMPPETIPIKNYKDFELDELEYNKINLESDLNSVLERYVYVCGSLAYHSWIIPYRTQQAEAGRKSAQRPRDERGRLLAIYPATTNGVGSLDPAISNGAGPTALDILSNGVGALDPANPTPFQRIQPSGSGSGSGSNLKKYKFSFDGTRTENNENRIVENLEPKQINFRELFEIYPNRNGLHRWGNESRVMDYLRTFFCNPEEFNRLKEAITFFKKASYENGNVGEKGKYIMTLQKFLENRVWVEYAEMAKKSKKEKELKSNQRAMSVELDKISTDSPLMSEDNKKLIDDFLGRTFKSMNKQDMGDPH